MIVCPPVPAITFLSDYGRDDEFVGTCHGVIAGMCPEARVIDITHGIRPPRRPRGRARAAQHAARTCPPGVHLAVVDPEVGAERRAVAVRCGEEDRLLVGPDNGLLSLAWRALRRRGRGGRHRALAASGSSRCRRPSTAATSSRRSRRSSPPATPLAEAGDPLDPADLVPLELPAPRREDGDASSSTSLAIDRFGNLQLDATHEDLAGTGLQLGHPVELDLGDGDVVQATYAVTFADVAPGELLVYEDAYRALAVAVNRGDAAARARRARSTTSCASGPA